MAGDVTPGRETVLETERLLLRPWRVAEAAIQRELWTERDPRVPPHRRIDADGRPTVEDLEHAIRIRAHQPSSTGLLAIERKAAGDVIGYCGLIDSGRGAEGGTGAGVRAAAPGLASGLRDRSGVGGPGLGQVVGVRPRVGHGLGLEHRVAAGAGQARVHRDRADGSGPGPRHHPVHHATTLTPRLSPVRIAAHDDGNRQPDRSPRSW